MNKIEISKDQMITLVAVGLPALIFILVFIMIMIKTSKNDKIDGTEEFSVENFYDLSPK